MLETPSIRWYSLGVTPLRGGWRMGSDNPSGADNQQERLGSLKRVDVASSTVKAALLSRSSGSPSMRLGLAGATARFSAVIQASIESRAVRERWSRVHRWSAQVNVTRATSDSASRRSRSTDPGRRLARTCERRGRPVLRRRTHCVTAKAENFAGSSRSSS